MRFPENSRHLVRCVDHYKTAKEPINEYKKFLYITNVKPIIATVHSIANGAGKQRWEIGNQGFNMQKNGGYNLEHVYSENENAAKCLYECLQIAHTINQLIEKGSLIGDLLKTYGSIKNLTQRLGEAFRFIKIEMADIAALLEKPFQIRLQQDSS